MLPSTDNCNDLFCKVKSDSLQLNEDGENFSGKSSISHAGSDGLGGYEFRDDEAADKREVLSCWLSSKHEESNGNTSSLTEVSMSDVVYPLSKAGHTRMHHEGSTTKCT